MHTLKIEIESLLAFKGITKADLSRLLNILPQQLNDKIKAKNLDIQFLTKVAEVLDCTFNFGFTDNKYKQKIKSSQQKTIDKLLAMDEKDFKLIQKLIDKFTKE